MVPPLRFINNKSNCPRAIKRWGQLIASSAFMRHLTGCCWNGNNMLDCTAHWSDPAWLSVPLTLKLKKANGSFTFIYKMFMLPFNPTLGSPRERETLKSHIYLLKHHYKSQPEGLIKGHSAINQLIDHLKSIPERENIQFSPGGLSRWHQFYLPKEVLPQPRNEVYRCFGINNVRNQSNSYGNFFSREWKVKWVSSPTYVFWPKETSLPFSLTLLLLLHIRLFGFESAPLRSSHAPAASTVLSTTWTFGKSILDSAADRQTLDLLFHLDWLFCSPCPAFFINKFHPATPKTIFKSTEERKQPPFSMLWL